MGARSICAYNEVINAFSNTPREDLYAVFLAVHKYFNCQINLPFAKCPLANLGANIKSLYKQVTFCASK